jgi:hypothetical protein
MTKKKNICLLVFGAILFSTKLLSQESTFQKDTLPIFVVKDKNIAVYIDSFLFDTYHRYDNFSDGLFVMYIGLFDKKENELDKMKITLFLRKQDKDSDPIILYKNPNYQQAFVLHRSVLFQANFKSYFDPANFQKLPEILKELPIKQRVYFKEPPPEFYDVRLHGEIPYEDEIMSWGAYFYNGAMVDNVIFYYND